MVEKPLSFSEGVVPLGHLCPLSSLEFMKDVVLGKYVFVFLLILQGLLTL